MAKMTFQDAQYKMEAYGYSILEVVKQYAEDHYNNYWDCVVEACTDEDLNEVIGSSKTATNALNKVYNAFVKPYKIQMENSNHGW